MDLFDKSGVAIGAEDIVLLDGHYYRFYREGNQWDAISCTNGYLHSISQEMTSKSERIGLFVDFSHLLICD